MSHLLLNNSRLSGDNASLAAELHRAKAEIRALRSEAALFSKEKDALAVLQQRFAVVLRETAEMFSAVIHMGGITPSDEAGDTAQLPQPQSG